MSVIPNKWVEKQKKKKVNETAPAYESNPKDSWLPVDPKKATKRDSRPAITPLIHSLRGVRK